MAVQGLNRTETCIVHHDRPAAARCGACHKPVCSSCVVSTADGKFCSHECAQKTEDYRKRAKGFKKGGTPIRDLARAIFWIALFIVFLGVVNKFMLKNDMPVVGKYLNKLPVLGSSAGANTTP